MNKNDTLAAYSDFTKWCRGNPHLNLDSRPHTHGGAIGDGGYISDEKTRIAFAAWRAAIKADRQQRGEPGAPAGWQLVPKEPTDEILDAMHESIRILVTPSKKAADIQNDVYVWASMLEAAPKFGEDE